jgi:hypothetical protein
MSGANAGNNVVLQFSSDNTNWVNLPYAVANRTFTSSTPADASLVAVVYNCAGFRYVRANVSAFAAAFNLTIALSNAPAPLAATPNTANPATPSDGMANTVSPSQLAFGALWSGGAGGTGGTGWVRMRDMIQATGSTTGQGVLAVGLTAFSGASYLRMLCDSSGNLYTRPYVPISTGFGKATIATTGTAVQFASQACGSVTFKALAANVAGIYLGTSTVTASGTTQGLELNPGESFSVDISNPNLYYINGTAGDAVTYIWTA